MKKLIAMILMIVLMMAMAAPALADNVGFSFTVAKGGAGTSSFGFKSSANDVDAIVNILSISGATYENPLRVRGMTYGGAEATKKVGVYLVSTVYLDYKSGMGVNGSAYMLRYWNELNDNTISGKGNFTP